MECERCKTEFRIFERAEGGFVRNVCLCEKNQRCDKSRKCGKPATQAWLDATNEVEAWRCDDHGDEDHAGEIPPPPEGEPPPPKEVPIRVSEYNLQGTQTGRLSSAVQHVANTPKPAYEPDEVVWARMEEELKNEPVDTKTKIKCTNCGKDHTYAQRKWKRAKSKTGERTLVSHCPKCDAEGFAAIM